MVKTFYYYYLLFYKNVFKDNDSSFTAKLALTASESLLVISVVDISSAYFFCWSLNKYYMAAITIIILGINFFVFNSEATQNIEKAKPVFFKNYKVSIAIVWLFFLITTSSMFWLGTIVQGIVSNCQK